MFWTLFKKQLLEIFRNYFYNTKKNTKRSIVSVVLTFLFSAIAMFGFIGGAFGLIAYAICQPFHAVGMGWMYFVIMGVLAVLLGTFGSVFSTYSTLYLSKDNDMLISLPIPTSSIIISRLTSVYTMGLMFSGIVSIPTIIVYWVFGKVTPLVIICSIIFVIIISLIVLMLSCILGWVVAKISVKTKDKSYVTVILSLIFFAIYYLGFSEASDMINGLIANVVLYGENVKNTAYPLYLFGKIGTGDIIATIIYMAVTIVLCLIVYKLLSNSFLKIVTSTKSSSNSVYKEKTVKRKSQVIAVLGKEFKRFTSSSAYMLNCSMGTLMIIIIAIVLLVKNDIITMFLDMEGFSQDVIIDFIPVVIVMMFCVLISINDIVVPSISLEGKNIWILQSLPINAWTVLKGKLLLHLILTGIPVIFGCISIMIALDLDITIKIVMVIVPITYTIFMALFGLFLAIKMPNLTWTNETAVLKQSAGILIAVFGGSIISLLILGLYFVFGHKMGIMIYLLLLSCIFVVLSVILYIWLKKKGSKIFQTL